MAGSALDALASLRDEGLHSEGKVGFFLYPFTHYTFANDLLNVG